MGFLTVRGAPRRDDDYDDDDDELSLGCFYVISSTHVWSAHKHKNAAGSRGFFVTGWLVKCVVVVVMTQVHFHSDSHTQNLSGALYLRSYRSEAIAAIFRWGAGHALERTLEHT